MVRSVFIRKNGRENGETMTECEGKWKKKGRRKKERGS